MTYTDPRVAGRPALLLTGVLMALPAGALAQGADATPAITVHGEGTVRVDPDRARVRLGVESEAPAARDAQRAANQIAHDILAAMGELGIEERDIQTSRLALYPVYENRPERPGSEPTITGYRATNTVTIELSDLTRIGSVVDAAIASGANRVEGVDFDLHDAADARARALTAAVDDARAKATAIAAALGVGLGRILETMEQGVSAPPIAMLARAEASFAQDVSTPIATGQIVVGASLTIRYAIDQEP